MLRANEVMPPSHPELEQRSTLLDSKSVLKHIALYLPNHAIVSKKTFFIELPLIHFNWCDDVINVTLIQYLILIQYLSKGNSVLKSGLSMEHRIFHLCASKCDSNDKSAKNTEISNGNWERCFTCSF